MCSNRRGLSACGGSELKTAYGVRGRRGMSRRPPRLIAHTHRPEPNITVARDRLKNPRARTCEARPHSSVLADRSAAPPRFPWSPIVTRSVLTSERNWSVAATAPGSRRRCGRVEGRRQDGSVQPKGETQMGTIKVTNSSTGKAESKDLDMAALLTVTRSQLGAFMLRSDVFLDTEDVRVPAELEKEAKLEEIVKDSAIRIAGEAAPGEGQDSPGTKDPKNAAPITASDGVLKPEVLPEAQWAADHVGLMDGLNKDGEPVEDDKVYQLKVGQVRNLLKANRINLNKERAGSAPGFVDNDQGINWAARDAVQCTEVEVKPPDANRITSISFQYTEHVSRLHRTTTTEGKANVGVPEIFDVQGSYRTSRATRTDKRLVKEHKSFNHLIPKARVLFNADKVSLSDEFIGAIRNAVQEREPAPKLLQVLGTYGQFFASDMVLGGRLSYWTDKVIDETYTETQDQDRFQLVTKARATIDGLPVEGGADWGYGLDSGEKQAVIKQAATLILKIVGGNAATASPEKWIPTVAKYLNWKVVGFSQRSLVPTIDYLRDDDLRSKCVRILRDYFARHLQLQQTIKVGLMEAPRFGEDLDNV